MGVGWGCRRLSALLISVSLNPLLARSSNFLGCKLVSGGEKYCIVYSLFCIFIIIIIITIIISSISSVALLNSLYLNHEFPLLSISPPHPTGGRKEVSERLSSA